MADDPNEPIDIREFLPEGATVEMVEPQQDLTPMVLQMLGQKEVELQVARNQIVQLQLQVKALSGLVERKKGTPPAL